MLNLYVETAAHLAPSSLDSVVTISLPSANSLHLLSRHSTPHHRSSLPPPQAKDEATYSQQLLANQGSIYFRKVKTYPRSFLWRVLEGNKVLELRCADLARSELDLDEAHLTVRFEVQDTIVPDGVALSDAEEQDTISVFIITASKELHTLTVPLEVFKDIEASSGDNSRWIKTFVPSSFTIDTPHRLSAHTPFELFVSLDSGRLQRLTRKAEDDGSYWTQDHFDEKSWSASLKGIVKWQANQLIPHESRYLSPTTANAMLASPDSTYLYTICLNHTLRVWSLTTGKLVVTKDLLDRPIRPQDSHTILSPATPSFLRLLKLGLMNHAILVTFSPHNEGQFKFWDVRGGLTEPLRVQDKFPGLTLRPPDPDPTGNTIWLLSGFEIRPGSIGEPMELWVLWRNNNFRQVYSLHFDMEEISEAWRRNWVKAQMSISSKAAPPDFVKSDPRDVTDKWMEFLLWPNRYPTSVLETSLSIYQEAMRLRPPPSTKARSLPERLCSLVASTVNLRKYNESELDYTRFASDVDTQWRNFWRIAEAINERRKAPLSLAFDAYTEMAWVIQSDHCCAIRECNDLELVQYNKDQDGEALESITTARWPHRKPVPNESNALEKMSQLLSVASDLAQSFSPEMTRSCENALDAEFLEEAEYPVPWRINDLYERCNFGDRVSNELYEKVVQVVESLEGLQNVGQLIPAVLALLPERVRGSHPSLRSTILGSIIVDAGLADTIRLGRQVVYNLLVLVIFLECEVNQDEEGRTEEFNAPELYGATLDVFKEYEKKLWLLSHVREVPIDLPDHPKDPPTGRQRTSSARRVEPSMRQVSLLRDTKGKDIKPQPAVGTPQSYVLTEMLNDIEVWVAGASEISTDEGCVWIECDLIAHGDIPLASEFARFLPNTPWSSYVKARLCLVRNEHEQAALYFQKAAYPLARGKAIGLVSEMSAGLLTAEDTDYFNNGLSPYLQHVVLLFRSVGAYSFAADFARLALAALPRDHPEETAEYQDEILSDLFAAELLCARYIPAYTVLTQFHDQQRQEECTIAWINALLGRHSLPRPEAAESIRMLQRLPLDLYPRIARAAEDHLTTLSRKQASVPGLSGSTWSTENGIDHLRILYALRVRRQDYHGAVSVLVDRLYLVKKSSQARNDPRATALRHTLLALINALSCVAPDEAYILTAIRENGTKAANGRLGDDGRDEETGWKVRQRVIITLEDLRREYQQLLDRCSRIERGDFDFEARTDDEEDDGFHTDLDTNGVDAMEV